ncbi:MAG TPA: Asp-tRNA(Asn)/Glu-tRNA(Gln) amidotransferase subunit GatC [Nitrospiria bacterium]|nr:Asp-tRNA(Asn)/Glu-tRNA(Gln) amidotransferase subunit GatC [Nitrospiria bacterium]
MKITREQVENVARLARLAISEREKELFTRQLGEILTYIEKLKELDTSKVDPISHVLPIKNIFREDEVRPSLPREEILKNAPDRTEEFFRVPKIIE